ncbi:hypothetical protein B9K06_21075 [Bacillus sp. OG2]|nr:hypothetical protein B9K06_21075 [Bacillus sp. OG2]
MLKSIVDKMIQWILEQQALKISGSFSAYFCACHRSPHSSPGRSGPFMGWRGFFLHRFFDRVRQFSKQFLQNGTSANHEVLFLISIINIELYKANF